jgi:feruloyl esterase
VQAIYAGRGRLVEEHPIGHEEGWQTYITGQAPPIAGPDGHLVFPFSLAAPAAYTFTNEFLRYFFFNDPTFDLTRFNLQADLPILERLRWMLDATNPDLTAFRAHDGKLLMTQGWADPALSAFAPVSYYDKVADTTGAVSTPGFFRLFMAPGMFHCAGGPGPSQFDSLTAMERWLNNGVAPDAIVAINPASGRTRPLCRYPTVAVYDGSGSIDESTNFTCAPRRRQ